jgi:RHS repeat-associated protein
MQPAPSTPFTHTYVPAMGLRSEKPHQGVRSKNPAPYRGHNRCNSRSALGLRAGCVGNRVRSRCSGEQYDPDLGLYYLRARYYNPLTGRFVSRDPLDGDPADPATLHKYLYANANPVDLIDPNGQEALVSYNQLVVGALVLATGAAIVNYEQHKDQTEGALRELGAGISCMYNELATLTTSWVAVGLAGDGDAGTVSRAGPCTFVAMSGRKKKSDPIPYPPPVNPGPGNQPNGCGPCPPLPGPWCAPGNAHGSTSGSHWHWYVWNQAPYPDCTCRAQRMSGPACP